MYEYFLINERLSQPHWCLSDRVPPAIIVTISGYCEAVTAMLAYLHKQESRGGARSVLPLALPKIGVTHEYWGCSRNGCSLYSLPLVLYGSWLLKYCHDPILSSVNRLKHNFIVITNEMSQ